MYVYAEELVWSSKRASSALTNVYVAFFVSSGLTSAALPPAVEPSPIKTPLAAEPVPVSRNICSLVGVTPALWVVVAVKRFLLPVSAIYFPSFIV